MRMFDSPERFILALFVKFRFAKSINSNTLLRSLNLFEFSHSSFVLSAGFNFIDKNCFSHLPDYRITRAHSQYTFMSCGMESCLSNMCL